MAYAYEGSGTTQTGKIIYKRKKHLFKSRDLRRLVDKLGFPGDIREQWDWIHALLKMTQEAQNIDNEALQGSAAELANALQTFLETAEKFEGFSGGEFGGAGASGIFQLPFPVWENPDTVS